MFSSQVIRAYRLIAAAAIIVAIAFLLIDGVANKPTFKVSNFFSFFTVESNVFAAIVLILLATKWEHNRTPLITLIRGAAVAYMATTGVVYGLLLSGYDEELQTTAPWANNIVHRIVPLIMVLDWVIDRPHNRLTFRKASIWAFFPIAYLVYSLIRGPIADWYPYPFLNPAESGGYPGVTAYAIGIALFFFGFIWLTVFLGNRPWEDRQPNLTT